MVDNNLFMYDLAVVAIMKNEGPYLKEWLDYHLLAGVDHFYLYDNESPDNQAEVAKPYVEAGLVDYIPAPGKMMQNVVYNEAVKRFKFQCRYMAFIDGDEFIFPKLTGGGVVEIVDEILSKVPTAAGLGINWQMFGSNGQERADYSRGVLERFTRRAPNNWMPPLKNGLPGGNAHVKTIANPRIIDFIESAHYPRYFESRHSVNESGNIATWCNIPPTAEKIIINHYHTKSKEEYTKKVQRGNADHVDNRYDIKNFDSADHNEIFDDGILKYREARAKVYQLPDKSRANQRLFNALIKNLLPVLLTDTPPNFYAGKLETFLTCRAVSSYLKGHVLSETTAKFFEETSLLAVLRSLNSLSFSDARLFIKELPNLLRLPYPVVGELRKAALQIIAQMMDVMRLNNMWKDFVELEYMQEFLRSDSVD